MNVVCSPKGIVDFFRPISGIENIKNAGFFSSVLDFSSLCPSWEIENINKVSSNNYLQVPVSKSPELLGEYATKFILNVESKGINIPVAIAPYLFRNTKQSNVNKLMEQLAIESIKVSGSAGCRYIVIRPLFSGIKKEELWKVNREYYLRLAKVAKENNVKILLENQADNYNGHLVRGICSDPEEAITWVDTLNEESGNECFGFCLNVGTCNICGQDMYDFITNIGNRLKTVILRDSDGHNETSLLPFTSVSSFKSHTDWLSLIRALREIEFDGELVFELEDTVSAVSPILRPELLKFSNSIAEYFKWQLDIERKLKQYKHIVLFGAGNMFKNYMRCYGEKYTPLFTCDNNDKIWGEKLFGIEIKSPEELKNIPSDCGIFICNMYYTEIQNQLRDMGIENNIEFFSDEYMPFLINKGCED